MLAAHAVDWQLEGIMDPETIQFGDKLGAETATAQKNPEGFNLLDITAGDKGGGPRSEEKTQALTFTDVINGAIAGAKAVAGGALLEQLFPTTAKTQESKREPEAQRPSIADATFSLIKKPQEQFEVKVNPDLKPEQQKYLDGLDAKLQNEHPNMNDNQRNAVRQLMSLFLSDDKEGIGKCLERIKGNLDILAPLTTELVQQGFVRHDHYSKMKRSETIDFTPLEEKKPGK